jgi:hypothetical protein
MRGGVTTTSGIPSSGAEKIWRYMSFSRFVWMLQKKLLWLSRADLLGDPWEIALTGEQLEFVKRRHPSRPIPDPGSGKWETAERRIARIMPRWRRSTFISCWSKLEHESHALWRIYCKSVEGVAIQTTLAKLVDSVGGLPVYAVRYGKLGNAQRTPDLFDLATRKQLWYAYEQEVRVVRHEDRKRKGALPGRPGDGLKWDPEMNLESIRVHPDADDSFMETVRAIVEHYAPALKGQVEWSEMRTLPEY